MFGTGWFANEHLKLLSTEPEVEIVGHVATNPAKALAAAQKWGGRGFTSCQELLESEKVEAAWICVPPIPAVHQAIEPILIEHNIPFFVEKPLAANLEIPERINEAINARQLTVGVGYHWRAMDTLHQVRKTIATNPVRMVVGNWYSNAPKVEWWQKQATGGGQIIEQATHLYDLARFLVGEAQVIAATANYFERPASPDADIAGVTAALLNFEQGATGLFSTTCILEAGIAVNLQLICDGLSITITQQKVIYDTGKEQREEILGNNPYLTEDQAFLEAVKYNRPSALISTYADALRTHRLCCEVVNASV